MLLGKRMNPMLRASGLPWDHAQANLDDILMAGVSFEDHLKNLDIVFVRLTAHGLKLNASKCDLFRVEVLYF